MAKSLITLILLFLLTGTAYPGGGFIYTPPTPMTKEEFLRGIERGDPDVIEMITKDQRHRIYNMVVSSLAREGFQIPRDTQCSYQLMIGISVIIQDYGKYKLHSYLKKDEYRRSMTQSELAADYNKRQHEIQKACADGLRRPVPFLSGFSTFQKEYSDALDRLVNTLENERLAKEKERERRSEEAKRRQADEEERRIAEEKARLELEAKKKEEQRRLTESKMQNQLSSGQTPTDTTAQPKSPSVGESQLPLQPSKAHSTE